MKTISLQEIFENHITKRTGTKFSLRSACIEAMREACNQAIELAAENAKIGKIYEDDKYNGCVNKQSILNTKNQIV